MGKHINSFLIDYLEVVLAGVIGGGLGLILRSWASRQKVRRDE